MNNISSPSTNMEDCSFSLDTDMEDCSFTLDTEYGSITFQFKDGGFSLSFRDGFRLQECWKDNPPKPAGEVSPPPSETKNSSPSLNFDETSPLKTTAKQDNLPLKATCNLPKNTGRSSPTLKRCNFPKKTTTILKQWLLKNTDHPYPSEEEKCRLAGLTNLSLRQVNDWMINARRRYLKNKRKYFGVS